MKARNRFMTEQQWEIVKMVEDYMVMDMTDPEKPEKFDGWVNHKPNISTEKCMVFAHPRMAVHIANRLNKILPEKHFRAYYWGLKPRKTGLQFAYKPVTRKFLKQYKQVHGFLYGGRNKICLRWMYGSLHLRTIWVPLNLRK